jgi:hypothetical protein
MPLRRKNRGQATDVEGPAGASRPARRSPRSVFERGFVRVVGTAGIVGIGAGVGAILASDKVQGWIIGVVVALVTLVLVVLLSSSRLLRRES